MSAEQESTKINPDRPAAWVNLAAAYGHLAQYDKEISAEQEAIRLKPDDEAAWYNLGFVYEQQGQRSEVIKVYQTLQSLDPTRADKFFHSVILPQEPAKEPQ